MKVLCVSCEQEGNPAVIREEDPLDDPGVIYGFCRAHRLQLREAVEGRWKQITGRQRCPRFPMSLLAVGRGPQLESDNSEGIRGMVRNVSAGGLMVELLIEVVPSSPMTLVLQTRQGPLEVGGRVVWTSVLGNRVRHGVAFSEPNSPDFAAELFIAESQ